MKMVLLFSPILLFLSSCISEEKEHFKTYFDFDSLVSSQLDLMRQSRPVLIKKTILNSKVDSLQLNFDTTRLKNELEIFRLPDVINKPMYKGLYTIETNEDFNSNLMTKIFSTTGKSPVPFVKLFLKENINELKRIETQVNETNIMIDSHRALTIEFDDCRGKPRLVHYRITSRQKMIFSHAVNLSIEGWLKYPV